MSYLKWDDRKRIAGYQGVDYLRLEFLPDAQNPTSAELTLVLLESFPGSPFLVHDFQIEDGRGRRLEFSLSAQIGAQKLVVLTIVPPWDAGQYGLRFLSGAGMKLDPFFAEASFTFHIACERGDCRPLTEVAERDAGALPVIDSLTKDYTGFVRLISDWVKVKNPYFADLSPASLERVLLDLLAHHGDMTSYFQDRVASEGFVETATQRHSLRQHATILGASLEDGAAAETWLAFEWLADTFVPALREVRSATNGGEAEVRFHTIEDARVLAQHSSMTLAAWHDAGSAIIPAGATEVLLLGHESRLSVGQHLAFVEGTLGKPGSLSQVVAITGLRFESEFGWVAAPADAPAATPVRITRVQIYPPVSADLRPWSNPFKLHGNVVRARHGRRESLGGLTRWSPSADDLRDPQNALIENAGGTHLLRAIRLPTGPVVHREELDPTGKAHSFPLVDVIAFGDPWHPVPHLHASAAFDRHYVPISDEDGSLWLQFGDGSLGRSVPLVSGATAIDLHVAYWVGEPTLGNCGAGALTEFVAEGSDPPLSVTNVVPGSGGRSRETKEAARFRLPASLKHGPLERAVTLRDYERAAKTVSGVARAVARDVGGPFSAVLVLVDPEGQVELSDELQRAVFDRLDALRMAGRELFVRGPRYVPIDVELALCIEPGHLAHRVRQAVLRALLPGTRAKGFFHPDRLSFDQAIELSDLLALVQRIPGVRSVKALRFRKLLVVTPEPVAQRIEVGKTEVIRMDATAERPENGRLEVRLVEQDHAVTASSYLIAD